MTLFRRPLAILLFAALSAMIILPASQAKAVKSSTKKRHTKQHKILYAPTGYERVMILLNKGKEYKYYLFSRETPLRLELEGPTTLTVRIRLLYDVTMKGSQNFTLTLQEEGLLGTRSEVASHSFTTEKSRISTFQGEARVVPSKARSFKLKVPNGKHRYTMTLHSTAAHSAAVRILIPKQDIKLPKKEKP